jgi:pimeloyl-ACP methyl ester carboxylesterase
VVLALHGQPGVGDHFDGLVQRLHSAGFTVLAPDRPGWGSRRQEAPRGFAANAGAAVRVLDEAGADQAVVVGYSWGGGVAVALARLHPARVAGLVLVASVGPGAIALTDRVLAVPLVGPLLCGASLAATRHSLRSPRLRAAWGRGLETLDEAEVLTIAAASKGAHSRRSFFTEQRALVGELPGLLAGLGAITVPTCVVTGEDDRLLDSAVARRLADAIPGATLRVVPGAGHLLPVTHPDAVAQAVITVAARDGRRPRWRSG